MIQLMHALVEQFRSNFPFIIIKRQPHCHCGIHFIATGLPVYYFPSWWSKIEESSPRLQYISKSNYSLWYHLSVPLRLSAVLLLLSANSIYVPVWNVESKVCALKPPSDAYVEKSNYSEFFVSRFLHFPTRRCEERSVCTLHRAPTRWIILAWCYFLSSMQWAHHSEGASST